MEDQLPHILLVEDNPVAQLAAKKIIEKNNCLVTVAATGEEALKLLENNKFNLIFMDIGLPDMDGLRVTEILRSRIALNRSVPVVALTANNNNIYQNQAVWVGMDGFVAKPLTAESCEKILAKFSLLKSPLSFHPTPRP